MHSQHISVWSMILWHIPAQKDTPINSWLVVGQAHAAQQWVQSEVVQQERTDQRTGQVEGEKDSPIRRN